MRIRRHFTSLGERGIAFDRRRALRWLGLGAGAVLAGYLTAYLILFPAPILPGHVLPDPTDVVAQVEPAGRLDAREDPHAQEYPVAWRR